MDAGQRKVTAQVLLALEAFMSKRGLDYLRAVRDVGIDPAIIQDPEARIPLRSVALLTENAARETGDDAFGAQLGTTFGIGTTGTLDYVVSNAHTLRTALEDYVRFLALVTDGLDTRFEECSRVGYLVTRLPAAFTPKEQLIDTASAARVTRIRHMMRDPEFPILVELERRKPVAIAEFARIFGARVRFEQAENRLVIANRDLDRELPAADPQLYKVVLQAAQRSLAEQELADDTMFQLVSWISSTMPSGGLSVAAAGQALNVSPHALKRRLADADTSFRNLVDETRKTMAHHYISETTLPMTEIAFLLGFSQLSAFSRASRGWFGLTPRALRRQARA